ncbi:hypothetical protein I5G59_gp60 [Mycobacterium phage LilMcDreamy]|uniref:Uncharacterized protein n=1 Tax=Mycobacterium phage LilMcDreamy TaxID=2652422 RepID=A0A5P8D9B1_9CAUD|nr:hypothetical protein I5G59_gp60 [Mycobacterium phage LilMcDreamy]QFP94680.1 hypothetical protein SEA_LILMCDREAMY_60 [Mycobacterium phage LilMcDreamy]
MTHPTRVCPLCTKPLWANDVRNALSRYVNDSICERCGTIEAFTLARVNDNPAARTCLYYDELSGIMLVNETEAGYVPIWATPPDPDWARKYVEAVNNRVDIEPDDMMTIVGRSMALGGVL